MYRYCVCFENNKIKIIDLSSTKTIWESNENTFKYFLTESKQISKLQMFCLHTWKKKFWFPFLSEVFQTSRPSKEVALGHVVRHRQQKNTCEKIPTLMKVTHWFTPNLLLSILLFHSVIADTFAFSFWTLKHGPYLSFRASVSFQRYTYLIFHLWCLFRLNTECECSDSCQHPGSSQDRVKINPVLAGTRIQTKNFC